MQKIAIPVQNNQLSQHFGHAPFFYVYDVKNKEVLKQSMNKSPEHTVGSIPNFLKELNITDLIVGGIGGKAIEMLNSANVNVFTGATVDTPDNIINAFIEDKLELNENSCDSDHHEHGDHHDHNCRH